MERLIRLTAVTDTSPLHTDCTDSAWLNIRAKAANPVGWMEEEKNWCRKNCLCLISGLSGNRFMSLLSFSSCWDTLNDVDSVYFRKDPTSVKSTARFFFPTAPTVWKHQLNLFKCVKNSQCRLPPIVWMRFLHISKDAKCDDHSRNNGKPSPRQRSWKRTE